MSKENASIEQLKHQAESMIDSMGEDERLMKGVLTCVGILTRFASKNEEGAICLAECIAMAGLTMTAIIQSLSDNNEKFSQLLDFHKDYCDTFFKLFDKLAKESNG